MNICVHIYIYIYIYIYMRGGLQLALPRLEVRPAGLQDLRIFISRTCVSNTRSLYPGPAYPISNTRCWYISIYIQDLRRVYL